ncbi:hypothetical protein IPN35_04300 [Candidatus Peregrinibacteria bacterium]|nr:MAG: hypothetical protein IPN35_04300 [Candidatus Peregrinibacteria bacterium]
MTLMNERMYNILTNTPYEAVNVQKLCRERSDFDDAFVSALFKNCLFQETGKELKEMGCLIANGGNGLQLIFPQSDKDYLFVPKEGFDGEAFRKAKEVFDGVSSTLFTIRVANIPSKTAIHANGQFTDLLRQLRTITSDGFAFQYIIREIEKVAKEQGVLLEVSDEEKLNRFLSHLLDALKLGGLRITEEKLHCIKEVLKGEGITSFQDIPKKTPPVIEAIFERFHIQRTNQEHVTNAYKKALQIAQKECENNDLEVFIHHFILGVSRVGFDIDADDVRGIFHCQRIEHIQQLPEIKNPVEDIIVNVLGISPLCRSLVIGPYKESLRMAQRDIVPNEEYSYVFSEFQRQYQEFIENQGKGDFEIKKEKLEKCLHDSIIQTLMIIRENMTSRYIGGDKETAKQYFTGIEEFIASNKKEVNTMASEQAYKIHRFFQLKNLDVKKELYRPFQTACINFLIEKGNVHHGGIEDLLYAFFQEKDCAKISLERAEKGLKGIHYVRMQLARYFSVAPSGSTSKMTEANTITPEFLEWAMQNISNIEEIFVDIQTALAIIEPISRDQGAKGISREIPLRDGFCEEKGRLNFQGSIEKISKVDFLISTLRYVGKNGFHPNAKTASHLYASAQKVASDKEDLLHFQNFFFTELIETRFFSEAILWVSRMKLLQEIFPAYKDMAQTIHKDDCYSKGDEMLASMLFLQKHVADDPDIRCIWNSIEKSGNTKVLRLALLIRNSQKGVEEALREVDPQQKIFSAEEITDVNFLVEHQRCLIPPGNKEGSKQVRTGRFQFDITVFGEHVNPIAIEALSQELTDKEHLLASLFALNLARKVAINPERTDLFEIKTALSRFYKQYQFLHFIRGALRGNNEEFFWDSLSDSFVEKTSINPQNGELEKYRDSLKKYPSALYTRMIDALGKASNEEITEALSNPLTCLEKVIHYFDYGSMQKEYETIQKDPEQKVAYSILPEKKEGMVAKIFFRVPRTSSALENMGIAFSNHHWSIDQASALPFDEDKTLVTLEVKYTGTEPKPSLDQAIEEYMAIENGEQNKILEKSNGKNEVFSEMPEVIICEKEGSVEIISYEKHVPAYALANILNAFGQYDLTPLNFTLVTKTRGKRNSTIHGIHDKFFFGQGVIIPKEISTLIQQKLTHRDS